MDEPSDPSFLHTDPGTPEHVWLADPGWWRMPLVDVDALTGRFDELLVLAAHPDDESLAVGGLVAAAHRGGLPVRVVVATDGEGSHPGASAWQPDALAAVRRREVAAAVEALAPGAVVEHLHLPDGGLADHLEELGAAVAARLRPTTLVLAPWTADGHPDHDALGQVAADAVATAGATVAHYPLWLWHWGAPADLHADVTRPGAAVPHVVELALDDLHRKTEALARHPSQTLPLGPLPGDGPVVTDAVLRRARRPVEVLLARPGTLPVRSARPVGVVAEPFDAMYAEGEHDPWGFEGSFSERRKRVLTTAVLRRPRYRRIVEVGCATGILTRELASRADEVVALDVSGEALAVARRDAPPTVRWVHGAAPRDVPEGEADLVVFSEVGYFLTPTELLETLRRVRRSLAPGGEVVLVHWRHPTEGVPLDGPTVHDVALAALADLGHRTHHEDADVLVDVLGGPESVAAVEGRR
ncbi:PIG-L family deacetylase [Phycicoccus avicenniae]|uniref:PIG-L family deacetylase n=1 Tax=Phycicoccus avicenniae TaxID=2828860 RepID=UPI003D27B142